MLVGFWTVYFGLHTLLASNSIKGILNESVPAIYKHYRIIYNTISTIGLFGILLFLATTPSELILTPTTLLKFTGLTFASFGVIFLKLAFKQYSIREFLGLKQNDENTHQLEIGGILKHVRHPIYTGTILIVAGLFLFVPKLLNLVTLGCVVAYILIGIQLEEKKLIKEFGEAYTNYKKKVPMLLPRFESRP